MPAKSFLRSEQVDKLQKSLRESELSHVRERILILLLQNDGKTQQGIANFLGCSPRTVAYWCMHGDPDRLESLQNQRNQESHRKATPEYIRLLLEIIHKEPSELGYEFGRWSGERWVHPSLASLSLRLARLGCTQLLCVNRIFLHTFPDR